MPRVYVCRVPLVARVEGVSPIAASFFELLKPEEIAATFRTRDRRVARKLARKYHFRVQEVRA